MAITGESYVLPEVKLSYMKKEQSRFYAYAVSHYADLPLQA